MVRKITQKYKRGDRVYIKKQGMGRSHFEQQCYGIVRYSYHQMHGSGNTSDYCIAILNQQDVIVDCVSWYPEHELLSAERNESDLRKLERYCNGRF